MTTRQILKQWFERGKKPTAAQFAEAFDSFWHKSDDTIEISNVNNLQKALNDKADTTALNGKANTTDLNNKADAKHRHEASDIDNLPTPTIDNTLNEQSTNAVTNQAITQALNSKAGTQHQHELSDVKALADTLNRKTETNHQHTSGDITDLESSVIRLINEYAPDTTQDNITRDVVYVADFAALQAVDEPDEEALYIVEDTGMLYKYRDGDFVEVEDTEGKVNNTIIVRGDFSALDVHLKQYQSTNSYNVVLIQPSNVIATYRFICTVSGQKISQSLIKDQRSDAVSTTRTRTGTIKTDDNVTWTNWTLRTPIYQETLDNALSDSSTNAVQNKVIKKELDNKQQKGEYLTSHQPLKTINGESLVGQGNIEIKPSGSNDIIPDMVNITYTSLVALIEANKLNTGQWYRITDFVTKAACNDDSYQSAEHPFDIAVMATSNNSLDCHARALLHENDDYFAKSRLDLWQVWYDIKNDISKYSWADTAEGKGVIYRLIDEWDNDRPYDFKNIRFRRYMIKGESHEVDGEMVEPSIDECPMYGKYVGFIMGEDVVPTLPEHYSIDEDDSMYFYAFSALMGDTVLDNSLGLDLSDMGGGMVAPCSNVTN